MPFSFYTQILAARISKAFLYQLSESNWVGIHMVASNRENTTFLLFCRSVGACYVRISFGFLFLFLLLVDTSKPHRPQFVPK